MIRPLIFALSRSRTAAHVAANVPGFRGFSRRFVAGERQADVIEAVRRLNAQGFDATVSFLGEEVTDEAHVRAAIEEFTSYARAIREQGLRSHLSIKLTDQDNSSRRPLHRYRVTSIQPYKPLQVPSGPDASALDGRD